MTERIDSRPYKESDFNVIMNSGKLDSATGMFFARDLEYVRGKGYQVPRGNFSALALFPISHEIPEGAMTFSYEVWDTVGMAKIISNYANDLPRADVVAKKITGEIQTIGNSYGYSFQEIRSARFSGKPIDARRAQAAIRAQNTKINEIAWKGAPSHNLPGFLTNTNIPVMVAPATSANKTDFASKTPKEIIDFIGNLISKVTLQSKGFHKANEVWLCPEDMAYIKNTVRSDLSDKTIYEWLADKNSGVTFKEADELAGAGANGKNVIFALEKSEENFRLEIPMDIMQHTPQLNGLEFEIPVESRIAGVDVTFPLAFVRSEY